MDVPTTEDANATVMSETASKIVNVEERGNGELNSVAQTSDVDSDSDTSSSEDEDETPTEWLATSRAKRSTAGNRLNALLQQAQTEEDPEDELNLLFAEDENGNEDGGFSDHAGHDSDVQMDSSSDSEQSGPEDDLEGERTFHKQEKAEKRAKQKKVVDRIPFVKKNVRIDPTTMKPPPPRPKKKSERVSWLPTLEDAPTRASARAATREKQVLLHADLVDRELKRLKTVQSMEKANAAREAKKRPAMTQAERLAEAARVEKANKKSLSRWQESENQREQEQRAKLEALKNRKLNGPVITLWSGWSEWVGDRLSKVGKNLIIEDPKEKAWKKRKASEMEEDDKKEKSIEDAEAQSNTTATTTAPATALPLSEASHNDVSKNEVSKNAAETTPASVKEAESKAAESEPIKDTEAAAVPSSSVPATVPEPPPMPIVPLQSLPPRSSVLAPPLGFPTQAPHPPPNFYHHHNTQNPPPYIIAPPVLDGSAPVPGLGFGHTLSTSSPRPSSTSFSKPPTTQTQNNDRAPSGHGVPPFGFPLGQHNYHEKGAHTTTSNLNRPLPPAYLPYQPQRSLVQELTLEPPKPEPPVITNSAVNYLILQNFDETAIKDKNVQTEIILKRRFQKQSTTKKPSQILCAITSLPARYRDPVTNLPYANAYAFKELRKLQRGDYKWSKLVGCYVGYGTTPIQTPTVAWNSGSGGQTLSVVARGVPIRFVNPGAKTEERQDGGERTGHVSLGQASRNVPAGGVGGGGGTVISTTNGQNPNVVPGPVASTTTLSTTSVSIPSPAPVTVDSKT